MTPSEFETRLRDLLREQAHVTGNAQCIECHGCEKCVLSTFCRDSKGLSRSHYCTNCTDCSDCSHCRSCVSCLGCNHCIASERCTQSAHLVRCVGLSACTYCFGSVGLTRKDFTF